MKANFYFALLFINFIECNMLALWNVLRNENVSMMHETYHNWMKRAEQQKKYQNDNRHLKAAR